MEEQRGHLFCFGYGYCSDYLGYALQRQGGWVISGTTRDEEKKNILCQRGISAHLFDYSRPLANPSLFLDKVTHVLISTPPDDSGDPTFNIHAEDILKIPALQWVGYLSSTSVYGNREGGWVDETSTIAPTSKRGSRRAIAESQWLSLFQNGGFPVHVFRLAGIYGPGRSALDSVRAGIARRIEKPGHAFSRIHVDDIADILTASMGRPNPGAIYNVADDLAAPSHEVIAYACKLLGISPPPLIPFGQSDMPPMAQSFYADNKRVSNEKIKKELGISLKHPDFRSGLHACLEAEEFMKKKSLSG